MVFSGSVFVMNSDMEDAKTGEQKVPSRPYSRLRVPLALAKPTAPNGSCRNLLPSRPG